MGCVNPTSTNCFDYFLYVLVFKLMTDLINRNATCKDYNKFSMSILPGNLARRLSIVLVSWQYRSSMLKLCGNSINKPLATIYIYLSMHSFLEIYVCVAYICIYLCVYIYTYMLYYIYYDILCSMYVYIYYINTSRVDMLGNVNEYILFFLFIMKTLKFFT